MHSGQSYSGKDFKGFTSGQLIFVVLIALFIGFPFIVVLIDEFLRWMF